MREEVVIPTVNGESLCFETHNGNPLGCSYIRFIDSDGNELVYWDSTEWSDNPKFVMGAIMGTIQNGFKN